MPASPLASVPMEAGVSVECVTAATESMIAAVEPAVGVGFCAAMEIAVTVKTAEAFSAAERCAAPEVPVTPEIAMVAAKAFTASEVSPPVMIPPEIMIAPAAAIVAPAVAIVVVPPAVAVVEVDPGRIVENRIAVKGRPVKSVKPRTRPDEDSANEPFRAVVAIRRTGIGGIRIVAVGADWRGSNVCWSANPNSDRNTHLRAGWSSEQPCQDDGEANHCGVP